MTTLYDVLGLGRQASAAQVAQAYQASLESLVADSGHENYERDMIRAKAIREAYAILSSPARREAYDAKLRLKEQPPVYEVVEKPGVPWKAIAIGAAIVAAAAGYYKVEARRAEVERVALETLKAKIQADAAAKLAEAEESRLSQQILQERRQADLVQMRQAEEARRYGKQIHDDLQRAEERAARDKVQAERDKANAERQARYEKLQEEQAAQNRSRNEVANMQRALNIPIVRH